MAWTTLTLQVTTPLFNGGADADGSEGFRPEHEAGIRGASIRGAMRFWFRALVGSLSGPDLALLAALERRVFGGISDQGRGGRSAAASPVLLRVPRQPRVVRPAGPHGFLPDASLPVPVRRQDESRWILYLMGQGLGDLAQSVVKRPYVAPGEVFDLKIGFRHATGEDAGARTAIEGLAFASLWLTCTYGGAGARTRRGFGGLRIIAAEGELPGPWQEEDAVLTPGLRHYERLRILWPNGAVASCMRYIRELAGGRAFDPRGAWAGKAPSFPVLSTTHTAAATSRKAFPSWEDTLIHAGEQFRHFRASKPNTLPDAYYRPKIETPEWGDVVYGNSDHFALGALGLPVSYKDGYVVNVDRGGSEPLRRASSLWMRAVGEGDEWRLLSFAFRTEFLPGPDAPAVHLWQHGVPGEELRVADNDVKRVSDQWIEALCADESFVDQRRRT